jgi:tetratricopeptide (TPR) repeat protein
VLEKELHRKATNAIPDFWEFRLPILYANEASGNSNIIQLTQEEVLESSSYSSLGGLDTKGKIKEIERLEKKLNDVKSDELKDNIISQLATLCREIGNYQDAFRWQKESLAIRKKTLGEEHPDTATSYNNLAGLYESMGVYEKAEQLYLKALKIREEVLGEEHPNTATTYNNLAGLYESMGAYEKAEPLYLKDLKISEKVLGEEHPSTATTYNNLAGLYRSMGAYEKAEPLYLKALKIRAEVLG